MQAHPKQPVRERQRLLDLMFAAAKKLRVEANLNDAFRVVETEKDETEKDENEKDENEKDENKKDETEKDETEKDEIESQYLDPEDLSLNFSPSDLKVVNKIYQHITNKS